MLVSIPFWNRYFSRDHLRSTMGITCGTVQIAQRACTFILYSKGLAWRLAPSHQRNLMPCLDLSGRIEFHILCCRDCVSLIRSRFRDPVFDQVSTFGFGLRRSYGKKQRHKSLRMRPTRKVKLTPSYS